MFIKGYSTIVSPLTTLLKKGRCWTWIQEFQQASNALKGAITKEPVLALPYLNKLSELHMDAFDFIIGSILMQEGHHIVSES